MRLLMRDCYIIIEINFFLLVTVMLWIYKHIFVSLIDILFIYTYLCIYALNEFFEHYKKGSPSVFVTILDASILRQFAKCDESVKLVLFSSFCSCYYCPYLWLDMTKHSARILRVAYNNAHRKIFKLHMRCSASQMFADNNLLNFEALMRKMSNTFISRLISSDNAIIKVLLDNMVAR